MNSSLKENVKERSLERLMADISIRALVKAITAPAKAETAVAEKVCMNPQLMI
jgi:hypothetical protein